MKIVVTGATHYYYSDSVVNCLRQLGHEVLFVELIEFYKNCNYIEKRLYRLGVGSLKTNYNQVWNDRLVQICVEFKADLVFALNGIIMLENPTLLKLHQLGIESVIWLIDSIKRLSQYESRIIHYNRIHCFEKDDLPYIKDKYGLNAYYTPVGFDTKAYFPDEQVKRDLDISFVANLTENRLKILPAVVEYAQGKGLSMQISGLWWSNRHFWKKIQFAKKYPLLAKYIHNTLLSASAIADIYRRSKICLNIHVSCHTGLNPRTFEILGTRSFQITEQDRNFGGIIRPGVDLATYTNIDDLLSKIDYYLVHESEREQIAANGYNRVKDRYTLMQMVQNIIK